MCLVAVTNPSSGLLGRGCCMLSVEHGFLDSPTAALVNRIRTVPTRWDPITSAAPLCVLRHLLRLSVRGGAGPAVPVETS